MEQRVSLITLGVANLAAARAFYGQGLGWTEVEPRRAGIALYQMPGFALALWPAASLAKDAGLQPTGSDDRVALSINLRSHAAVDDTLAEALRAGGRLLKPAGETSWGGYAGYFADPDGHAWEVAHNPFCVVRPDGATTFAGAMA